MKTSGAQGSSSSVKQKQKQKQTRQEDNKKQARQIGTQREKSDPVENTRSYKHTRIGHAIAAAFGMMFTSIFYADITNIHKLN